MRSTHSPRTPKPRIDLKKMRTFTDWWATFIATAGGAGLFPVGPGTAGSLIALPMAWATNQWPSAYRYMFWCLVFIIGTWSSTVIDRIHQCGDNQSIVIDEVIGIIIAAWTAGTHWQTLCWAFMLFRVFDIAKPPPIRQVDRWSKTAAEQTGGTKGQWIGGFGVMIDDVIAATIALAIISALQYDHLLP